MCGPSGSETQINAQQESLASQLNADFSSRFQSQSDLLSKLSSSISPIIAAGPNQQGFNAAESAVLNTQAINASGAAARNAKQVAGNFSAGQNNSSGLQSGVQQQIEGSIDSSAANQLATEQNQITQANYNQGRQNYFAGLNALQGVTSQYDPTQFSSQAGQNYSTSFNQADKIQQEKNQEQADIAGGLASLAMDSATFGGGALGGGGFDFAGGLQALTGKG
jgi:hypothetical protein